MTARRTAPTIHTLDRALRDVQRELAALRQQSNPQSTAAPRQGPRGSGKVFAPTGRGPEQVVHEIRTTDYRPARDHDHFLIYAAKRLELTEAWMFPTEDFTAVNNYSSIRILDHEPNIGQDPADGRLLGYISGERKTAGPWATGDLRHDGSYAYLLEENTTVEKGHAVLLDTVSSAPSGRWPEAYMILCWRWLD